LKDYDNIANLKTYLENTPGKEFKHNSKENGDLTEDQNGNYLACFTKQEYKDFLERFPNANEVLEPYKKSRDDEDCIDIGKIPDKKKKELGEAFNEVVKHANYSVVCLIPSGDSENIKDKKQIKDTEDTKDNKQAKKQIKFSEAFEYGIKESIKRLEFPGDDLISLDKEHISNIVSKASNVKEGVKIVDLIKDISKARYCIIDITEGHPEVFYWLGFIHGLRVNPYLRIREDLTCLYITQGALEKLPFDIRAARVVYYNSLDDLHLKIPLEIEKLEVSRINELNKEKLEFWKTFNIKNTKFLIGAADICHPGADDYNIRDKISLQDFKTFNRIIYLFLFLGGKRRPYQYNIEIIGLYDDNFIGKKKGFTEEEYKKFLEKFPHTNDLLEPLKKN
jgi:hypothetical protein